MESTTTNSPGDIKKMESNGGNISPKNKHNKTMIPRKRSRSFDAVSALLPRKRNVSFDATSPKPPTMSPEGGSMPLTKRKRSKSFDSNHTMKANNNAEGLGTITRSRSVSFDGTKLKDNDKAQKSCESEESKIGMQNSSSTTKKARSPSFKKQQQKTELKPTTKKVEKQTATPMELSVHRLRHLNHIPSAVQAMSAQGSLIAISRENGALEIRDINESCRTLCEIAGTRKWIASVLEWTPVSGASKIPVLLGASSKGLISIIDWERSQICGTIASGGGGVFDMACCTGTQLPLIITACQDGCMRIVEVSSKFRRLEIIASSQTSGGAILSVTWRCLQQITKGNITTYKTVIFCGVADGTIRRYECQITANQSDSNNDDDDDDENDNNDDGNDYVNYDQVTSIYRVSNFVSRFRMTVESFGRKAATRVWKLLTLSDGTVISGNSAGLVQFWDGNTGTLIHSIEQTTLKADVLTLAVSADENKVFASGVDSRVVTIERQKILESEGQKDRPWLIAGARRPHTHDVKAMVICHKTKINDNNQDDEDEQEEILVSGGMDTKLATYSVSSFIKKNTSIYYSWPIFSPIHVSPMARVVMVQRQTKVDFYNIESETNLEPRLLPDEKTALLGSVMINTNSNLVTSCISSDGKHVAIADSTNLFLFELTYQREADGSIESIIPHKLPLPVDIASHSFVSLSFGAKQELVVAEPSGRLHVLDIVASGTHDNGNKNKKTGVTLQHSTINTASRFRDGEWPHLPIHSIHISEDGKWITTLQNRINSAVHIYKRGKDGSLNHYWTLPSLMERPVAAIFLSNKSPQLAVCTPTFQIYLFQLKEKKLHPWSMRRGFPTSSLPPEIKNLSGYPVRLSVNPAEPTKLIMASFGAFCVMDLTKPLPKYCRMVPKAHVRNRRQKKRYKNSNESNKGDDNDDGKNDNENGHCTICLLYTSMLYLNFLSPKELIVVEQPWLEVLAALPEPVERRIYGYN